MSLPSGTQQPKWQFWVDGLKKGCSWTGLQCPRRSEDVYEAVEKPPAPEALRLPDICKQVTRGPTSEGQTGRELGLVGRGAEGGQTSFRSTSHLDLILTPYIQNFFLAETTVPECSGRVLGGSW